MQQILGRLPIGDQMYLVEGDDGEAVMTNKLPLPTEVFSIPGRNSRYFDNPCIQVSVKLLFMHRIQGSLDPRIQGSLDSRIQGSLGHRIQGSLSPRIQGSLYPWILGSSHPQIIFHFLSVTGTSHVLSIL